MSESGDAVGSPCPEDARLYAFSAKLVDDREAVRISTHLLECGVCYAKVATLVRMLRGTAAGAAPPWPLLPAFATAVVIALALTIALSLLLPAA